MAKRACSFFSEILGNSGFHGRSLIFVSVRVFTIDGILQRCSRKSLSAFVINLTWPSIFRRSTLVVSARRSCPSSEVAPDFETVWRLGQDGFRVFFLRQQLQKLWANASFEMKSPVLPGKIYRRPLRRKPQTCEVPHAY